MPRCDSTRKSDQLQRFMEEISQDLSRATGFVQRRSKMTGAQFLKTVVLGWAANLEASLNELVQRSAQRKQHGMTAKHLTLQTWNMFITNVPQDWLDSQQVLQLYRIRWQVELLFKPRKSQAKLSQVGRYREARIVCQLYARLIAMVLFNWVAAPQHFSTRGELSFPKAWRVFQHYAVRLTDAIASRWRDVPQLLAKMAGDFLRFALKNSRKKSPSTYQCLVLSGA